MLVELQIHELASRFRSGLEHASKLVPSVGIPPDFPSGFCGDASLMLAQFLASQGAGHVRYVSGKRFDPEFCSHAWCEADGMFVDITGDQFQGRPAVVVATSSAPWFKQWQIETTVDYSDPAFQQFASPSMRGYDVVLATIRAKITKGFSSWNVTESRSDGG